jgi:hypothetical protein
VTSWQTRRAVLESRSILLSGHALMPNSGRCLTNIHALLGIFHRGSMAAVINCVIRYQASRSPITSFIHQPAVIRQNAHISLYDGVKSATHEISSPGELHRLPFLD